jgi:NitT/TauT family transport system permease protein/sulfonate transport system permease protein
MRIPERIHAKLFTVVTVIVIITLWQAICAFGKLADFIPSPFQIVSQFSTMLFHNFGNTTLLGHVWASLKRVIIAFVLANIIGIPLGLFMGWNQTVDSLVRPIFETFRPIPPIAWIPMAILWFGVGETPKIFICFIAAFIPAVINSYAGIKYTDPILIDAALTLGAAPKDVFLEVAVPSALPAIFAGLQNGLSVCWMTVLAAEMVGATEGVGFIILKGMDMNNPVIIVTGMLTIGLLGAIIAIAIRHSERLVCPWKREISL